MVEGEVKHIAAEEKARLLLKSAVSLPVNFQESMKREATNEAALKLACFLLFFDRQHCHCLLSRTESPAAAEKNS
jgi:hypothetical protein